MQTCPLCKQDRLETDFGKDRRCNYCCRQKSKLYRKANREKVRKTVKQWRIEHPENQKAWLRKASLKRFGLTEQDYSKMLETQHGVCAVCKEVETEKDSKGRIKPLAVDHCHKTNRIRGLLCGACNKAEGLLKGDVNRILALASYLTPKED